MLTASPNRICRICGWKSKHQSTNHDRWLLLLLLTFEESEVCALVKAEYRLAPLARVARVAGLCDEILLDRVEEAIVVVLSLAQLDKIEARL